MKISILLHYALNMLDTGNLYFFILKKDPDLKLKYL